MLVYSASVCVCACVCVCVCVCACFVDFVDCEMQRFSGVHWYIVAQVLSAFSVLNFEISKFLKF